jgi:hypothetical protein
MRESAVQVEREIITCRLLAAAVPVPVVTRERCARRRRNFFESYRAGRKKKK